MKIFLDTNIVIDFLTGRQPFVEDAIKIFQLSQRQGYSLLVSDLSLINVAYICRKNFTKQQIYSALAKLTKFVTVVSIGSQSVKKAINIQAEDFEDAAQCFCAVRCKADCIVTRDTEGFRGIYYIKVMGPKELLHSLDAKL